MGVTCSLPDSAAAVEGLRRMCQSIGGPARMAVVRMGIEGVDSALPRSGLDREAVHEWIGVAPPEREQEQEPQGEALPSRRLEWWTPPLTLLTHLARALLAASDLTTPHIVWIGEAIRPYSSTLARPREDGRRLLDASIFVRANRAAERLWAADLALRSRAAAAVIADGAGFDLASTRRLQLAAEAGGAICFLARPPWERSVLSSATTRWMVRSCPSPTFTRRWNVELLRCKGMQPAPGARRAWTLERDHETRALRVAADLLHRSREETMEMPARLAG